MKIGCLRASNKKLQFTAAAVLTIGALLISERALAMGKSRTEPAPSNNASNGTCSAPNGSYRAGSFPSRLVGMGQFNPVSFMLPNGAKLNMAEALPLVMITEMSESSRKLRPSVDTNARYQIAGGITGFEANIEEYGLRFGWTPGAGDIGNGAIQGAQGEVRLKLSHISMDFYIVDTKTGEVITAKSGTSKEFNLSFDGKVDFGLYQIAGDFVTKSPLTPLFRTMVRKIVEKMVADPYPNFKMAWSSGIADRDNAKQTFVIDKGLSDEIILGDQFDVYNNSTRVGLAFVSEQAHSQSVLKFFDDTAGEKFKLVGPQSELRIYFSSVPKK